MNLQHRHRYPSYKVSVLFATLNFDTGGQLKKYFPIWDGSPQKEVIIANMKVSYNAANSKDDAVILVVEHGKRGITLPPDPFTFTGLPAFYRAVGTGNINQRVWQGIVSPIRGFDDDEVNTIITNVNAFKLPKSDQIYLIAQRPTTDGGTSKFSTFLISFDVLEI